MTDRPAINPLEFLPYPEDGGTVTEGYGEKRQFLSRAIPPTGGAIFILVKDGVYSVDGTGDENSYGSEAEAMAAANATHASRIRSCLLDKPEAVEGEPVAWTQPAQLELIANDPTQGGGYIWSKRDMAEVRRKFPDIDLPEDVSLYAHPPASSAELDRLRRELEEARKALERFRSDRAYIIGCDDGWEAALADECSASAISQLNAIVDAWESLPGGRQVRNRDVEDWLAKDMAPAINAIREYLQRPKPDTGCE